MLKILCILTFVWSGLNMAFSLCFFLFFEQLKPLITESAETFKFPELKIVLDVSRVYFLVSAMLFAGSIFGALRMFRLKRDGFHFYTIAQIMLILSAMFFFRLPSPSLPELLISAIFVMLYSRNLKFLR
ncbi:MAG TPA: hypothetical protein VLR52_05810, partial [Bacteroidales bacterium]|nr:hypothetical protein [Bacteroidales bacterium]